MKNKLEDNFSYDKSLAEIEKILQSLEESDVKSLEKMMASVEKAMILTQKCKERLCGYEEKFEKMLPKE